jgi:Zn-dependent protease
MTDPLTWSPINLGRWAGTQVRIHSLLIFYVVTQLLMAAVSKGDEHHTAAQVLAETACWLVLLLLALAVHELGHAATASWLGCERDDIRLWPLGNMITPSIASRSAESMFVAAGGLMINTIVVLLIAIGLNVFANAHFHWYPVTPPDNPYGAPLVRGEVVRFGTAVWFVGTFGFLNWVIMLANLIPALPFDMGRIVRAYLANSSFSPTKDQGYGIWLARCTAAVLGLVGICRILVSWMTGDGFILILLAVLIELMVRSEARMLEDGGFYEDGVFGYDFSEGYTSLEGSAAKVRPYRERESALKKWRRMRSELRRQRRLAREAAEEKRMDEILAKLHQEGRAALTDEEHRFLVRVSSKYRNRSKNP